MFLYHGSNLTIVTPDTDHTRKNGGKDFGTGFYLTGVQKMAKDFARKVAVRERDGIATVSSYEICLDEIDTCLLKIKVFREPSPEWFVFVYKNRNGLPVEVYDIVIGPVADNGLPMKFAEYERMVNNGEQIDLQKFANAINYHVYPNVYQYCFRSIDALNLLKYTRS